MFSMKEERVETLFTAEAASPVDAAYIAALKGKTAKPEHIERFLSTKGNFRVNIIKNRIEFKAFGADEDYLEVEDYNVNSWWSEMTKSWECKVSKEHIYYILGSNFLRKFNPFVDYFTSLPEWDGIDYIAQLAEMIEVKPQYGETKEDAQKWFYGNLKKYLVGLVAGALKKDIINHQVLVLLGKQGILKSTWLRLLIPPELRDYVYTKNDSSRLDKDDMIAFTENILAILDDFEGMSPADFTQLKATITQPYITERRPYARYPETRKKTASFAATSNIKHILQDETGDRRFIPVEAISIVNPLTYDYNYEGIYSQVMHLLNNGFKYWFDREDIEELTRRQADFRSPSPEEELLLHYFSKPESELRAKWMKATTILEVINAGIKQVLSSKKLAIILDRLGFEKKRNRNGIFYKVQEKQGSEINAEQVFNDDENKDCDDADPF